MDEVTQMGSGVAGVDAYGRGIAQAAGQAGAFAGQSGIGLTQSYQNDYKPYDNKLMGFVDHLGSEGYRSAQRGLAMNQVQMQADAQNQQMQRQMLAGGVNLGDPRYAFLQGQMAQQTALNKTMAAMGSDRNSRDEWVKGLGAINAMGLKVGELGNKNLALAADFGKLGLMGADLGAAARARETQANAAMTSASAAGSGAAASMHNAELNYKLGLGRLALDRYNIDTGNTFKQQQLDAARKATSLGNVAGSTLLGAAGNALINWAGKGGAEALGKVVGNLFGGGDGVFGTGAGYDPYSGLSYDVVPQGGDWGPSSDFDGDWWWM